MRRRYLVSGVVQGVGFRFFARRVGQRLGLAGWVRNLPDGRVEAEAVGPLDLLETFARELSRGPAGGLVSGIEVIEVSDEGSGATGFEVWS
jgi:acylphosphatase